MQFNKAVHRFALFDADYNFLTTILIDYPIPTGYVPSYGSFVVDEGPAPGSTDYVPPEPGEIYIGEEFPIDGAGPVPPAIYNVNSEN